MPVELEIPVTGNTFFSLEKVPAGRSGGATQAETRVYNERLIVSLIRRHGQLAKADLTRLTGLAPQTITMIVNRAADEGLLVRREPLRGQLGQPSVPYALNPEAAFSFGLKVDHRSVDVALVNLVGDVLAFERQQLEHPQPATVMEFARTSMARLRRKHRAIPAQRIAGVGIASPVHQWRSKEEKRASNGPLAAWRDIDIRAELDRILEWPVFLLDDAVVSASAELMFRGVVGRADFLYAYIGHHVGGALVLDYHLFPGRNNLAGALGDMPMPGASASGNPTLTQSISLRALAEKSGGNHSVVWTQQENWDGIAGVEGWIDRVADGLADVARSAVTLIDIDNLVIDGAMPASIRREIAKGTRRRLARAFSNRPEPLAVIEGSFGHRGPVVGAASIPLLVKYSNDKDLLFKT